MDLASLTRSVWNELPNDDRFTIAQQLEERLPNGFRFRTVRHYRCGEVEQHVALFAYNDTTFSLIPGDDVQLGYDSSRWRPTDDELASLRHRDPHGYIEGATRDSFRKTFMPFLCQTHAFELGWDPLPPDDARVIELKDEYLLSGNCVEIESDFDDVVIRVRLNADGTHTAHLQDEHLVHQDVVNTLRSGGFRLPTVDEWEYANSAGAQTLFRWGDHVPCDHYPTEASAEEREWATRWAQSMGEIERPPGGFESSFNLHILPNAFGLSIAFNPYQYELTDDPHITRGGDGGCRICGGEGFFRGWLPLAPAWFTRSDCTHRVDPITPGYTYARRVFPLDEL